MNISGPAIRRPIATSLLFFAVLFAGIIAYRKLPVSPLPQVDFPAIMVQASLPGASPETMASSVAMPLERRFGRIAGLTEVTSSSSLGTTMMILQFDLNRDVEAAARDVQAAINAAGGELPTNLPSRPTYRKVNPSDAPILILALTSNTLSIPEIYDAADSILAQKISQIEGVGQVTVGGAQSSAVRIRADPYALAGAGLTLADMRTTLVKQNVNIPKGSLQGTRQAFVLSTNDQLSRAEDYSPLILQYTNGSPLRVQDVANVFSDVQNNRLAAWFGEERAVLLLIRRAPGANILETVARVKAIVPQLQRQISPQINIHSGLDRAVTVAASVSDTQYTLILTIFLVVCVVFVFLRNFRSTIIPSITVPLSVLGTFCVMYVLGYSIDNLSLMALTISIGFVVDDAIVVTENIMRLIEEGYSPHRAALVGAQQIGFTILSITLSLLAVFIPLIFMQGIVGRLFKEFSMTLAASIAVSAIVSLTLTPVMCALMLRPEKRSASQAQVGFFRLFERGFDAVLEMYKKSLRWTLIHRHWMILTLFGTIVVTIYLFIAIPKGLFPQQDTGLIMGMTESSQDISFEAMMHRQKQINKILLDDPDIANMVSFIGSANGSSGNTGNMFINLREKPEREKSSDEIINRLRPKLAKIDNITAYLQSMQDFRVGGRSARTQYQYTVQSANLADLKHWAPRIFEAFSKLPELKDVATDQQTAGLQLNIAIDRDTASKLGITPKMIDDALYDAFGQRQISIIYTGLNQYRVVLEVDPKYQLGPASLESVYVGSSQGAVPLASMVTVTTGPTPLSISHQGQFPSVTISFNLAGQTSLGQAVDAITKVKDKMSLPASIQADFAGTAQAFGGSSNTMPFLILMSLMTVYVVLGILYESFVHPITILSTLPSAGLGALAALMLFRLDLSVIALIGLILLIGIVKKNAIMMIDFALEAERVHGSQPVDAIFQACLLRFRPIMMTTAASLFGAIPMAIGQGMGAELRRPLGITIIGGLLISQLLTLYTTPIVYLALNRLERFFKRRP